jgi:hypothetical protein
MRHVFASRPVSARALGMPEPPSAARLVTRARRALATPPRMRAAISGAVNLAAIATTANQRLGPTAGAQKQSGRSSVVMIGLAAAIWTRARLSAILIGHACPARCGARRRAEPPILDRRRACPGKGQAYPNIRRSVRAPSRTAASTSDTRHHRLEKPRGSRQAHNRAIYARIFTAIDTD